MSGNLWEWVQDEYHDNYNGAPREGSGWCTGVCPENASDPNYNPNNIANRVLRGGGWTASISEIQAATRLYFPPTGQDTLFGGRLSRPVQ